SAVGAATGRGAGGPGEFRPGEAAHGGPRGSEAPDQGTAAGPARPTEPPDGQAADGAVRASPMARRLAAERGVDLARVEGSGPAGRVMAADVEGSGPAGQTMAAD